MIYSFDVFDTTLTRVVSNPRDLFFLIQQELKVSRPDLPESLRRNFPKMRIKAELMARVYKKKEDVRFDEIYTRFAKLYSVDPSTIELLKQLELKTELSSCRRIARTIMEINRSRLKGAKIIFSSDMYLPKECIQSMLELIGAYQSGDKIYMSGEVGFTKRSGNLFRYILKEEGVCPKDLTHVGDNYYSDIFIPSLLGIRVVRCSSKLNRYEKIIRQSVKKETLLASLISGASKSARLSSVMVSPHKEIIQEVSSSVIGPSFLFFVWWAMESAQRQGLRRLYFLSRDGEILLHIGKIINSRMGYDLDLRYLHTSREAWCWPAIQEIGSFEFSWMFDLDDNLRITLGSISQRLDVPGGLLLELINKSGLNINAVDVSLSSSQIEDLKKIMLSSGFLNLLQARIDSSYRDTVAYLSQEGVLDGVDFGLVDIGWRGTLQYALSKIMDKKGGRPNRGLTGFYFGLENDEIRRYKNDQLLSFFIDPKREYLRNNVLLCEVFAASASYHTKGYDCSKGKCLSVFDEKKGASDQWGIGLQQESILTFINSFFSVYFEKNSEREEIYRVLEKILKLFIFFPSVQEANVYGDFPLSVRFLEGHLTKFAPPIDPSSKALPRTYWVPGTLARCGLTFLAFLWQLVAYNPNFVKLCRNFYLKQRIILSHDGGVK